MTDLDKALNIDSPWWVKAAEPGKELYYGIADCHGIESFKRFEEGNHNIGILQIRAQANDQRHAVVYIVALYPEMVRQINALLKKQQFKRALTFLKSTERIWFTESRSERLWNNIPNSSLDPWNSEGYDKGL